MKRKRVEKKVGKDGMTAAEIRASGKLTGVEVRLFFTGCKQTIVCTGLEAAIACLEQIRDAKDAQIAA